MMYPKIGIRPVIDGRWGGIRESLEAQTMGMAHAAKALIETLKYPDGTPVQVVVSPCTIGGGAEAARCEEYFSAQNVTATLTVTPCWCYGMETFDMNPLTIKAVWGFNGTERPARYIWRQCWPPMPRRDCPPSPSTAMTCRTWVTPPFPPTWKKRFCGLPAAPSPPAG